MAETVSFWLSYAHSKKVRKIFGRILLECLHDSQDAQIAFCENQDVEGGTNFTPAACSLVVLNVVMQNLHIFKDARQYNSFKKHCCTLKAELDAAPGPVQSDGVFSQDEYSGLIAPPKCWTYKLSD